MAAGQEYTAMKRTRWIWIAYALLVAATARGAAPQRIVSLVPSATETIFAIGAGARVVGVSNYDRFPSEVLRLTRVGGLLDPDVERIIALRPDLVVVYATQTELRQRLDRAAIPYYAYEHRTLADVTGTIRSIGARIQSAEASDRLAAKMDRAIAAVRAAVAGRPRPRTLLVIGRDTASLKGISASAGYGFLHDMLEAAGAADIFADVPKQSIDVSTETVLARRPDVIIELRYGESVKPSDIGRELRPWNTLASVPAVKSGRVYMLVGDEFVVPGPRVVTAIRRLAHALHPEVVP
jgi:iron complex transport system substrate-binding protein